MSNNSEQSNIYNLQLEQIGLAAIRLNEENYWNVSEIVTPD